MWILRATFPFRGAATCAEGRVIEMRQRGISEGAPTPG